MYQARMNRPESGNPYYNTENHGGYLIGIIDGVPYDAGCNVLSNCVGYAVGRFAEIQGRGEHKYFRYAPNAEDFCDVAKKEGLSVGTEPQLGAIICWGKGSGWNSDDGAGHVAVVEKINDDGTITTSESGYGCSAFWTTIRRNDGNWGAGGEWQFKGFVYQPTSAERILKRGMSGDDVGELQKLLIDRGYLPTGQDDGIFGTLTFSAVCGYQCDKHITVDGIVGSETRATF